MSECQKKQFERICVTIDALNANNRETALAYMQGMTAGAKLAGAGEEKPDDKNADD